MASGGDSAGRLVPLSTSQIDKTCVPELLKTSPLCTLISIKWHSLSYIISDNCKLARSGFSFLSQGASVASVLMKATSRPDDLIGGHDVLGVAFAST
jgi:hypothetical protein